MPDLPGTLKPPRLASAPSSPVVGQMYYDTAANLLKWWNGTSWVTASASGALPADVVNPAITRLLADFALAGDTQPLWRIYGDGTQQWGPGGSTPPDTNLFRNGAGLLKTDSTFHVGLDLTVRQADSRQIIIGDTGSGLGGLRFGFPSDTNLYRVAANTLATGGSLRFYGAAVNSTVIGSLLSSGDTAFRFMVNNDGSMLWGSGTAVQDAKLYRVSAGYLVTYGLYIDYNDAGRKLLFGSAGDTNLYRGAANTLKTDSNLQTIGDYYARVGDAQQVIVGFAGPASQAGLKLGSAGDTNLYRNGATVVKTDGSFEAATYIMGNGCYVGDMRGYIGAWASQVIALTTDTVLYRAAAGVLATSANFQIDQGITMGGYGYPAAKLWLNAPKNIGIWAHTNEFAAVNQGFIASQGAAQEIRLTYNPSAGYGPAIYFGSAQDTNLYRGGAAILATDGQFWANSHIYAIGSGYIAANYGNAKQVQIGDVWYGYPAINFGTANDTAISRLAAGQLLINNGIHVGGSYQSVMAACVAGIALNAATAPPSGNPTSGGILYTTSSGSLIFRSTSGKETVLATA